MRTNRIISWVVTLALVFALWWFVFPPQLGGRTLLLTTHGVSMEPLLHDGDFAILRKQSKYKVGDVVEYHSKALNTDVLHRIISIDENGISTKGDNNNFIDMDHPSQKDLRGKMIHRFEGGGKYLAIFKSWPVRIIGAALAGLAVYWAFSNDEQKDKLRRRSREPKLRARRGRSAVDIDIESLKDVVIADEPQAVGYKSSAALAIGGVLASVGLLVSIVSWTHSASSPADQFVIYNMRGVVNYSGDATGGDLVYRNGKVKTGDTIYASMVKQIVVTYDYRLEALGKFKGDGTISLDAELQGSSGWTHPVPLVGTTAFEGDTAQVSAAINFDQMRSLVDQINALTKVSDVQYKLVLKPTVSMKGTLSGAKLDDTFAPSSIFDVTPITIKPQITSVPGKDPGPTPMNDTADSLTGLETSKGSQVTLPAGSPQRLKTLGITAGVITMRAVGAAALLGGLGLLSVGLMAMRRRPTDEIDSVVSSLGPQYREMLVPVSKWGRMGSSSMIIDVPTFDDLARVADAHGCLILHDRTAAGSEVFVITHGHLTYRYEHISTPTEDRFGVRTESNTGSDDETWVNE